jgi:hypothetical protein
MRDALNARRAKTTAQPTKRVTRGTAFALSAVSAGSGDPRRTGNILGADAPRLSEVMRFLEQNEQVVT